MGDIPVDARRVVDGLRAARRARLVPARSWVPSEAFEAALSEPIGKPVHENEDLAWMHRNHDFSSLLRPPVGHGLAFRVKLVQHRLLMALLRPFFEWLQEWVKHDVRAIDHVSRRSDDLMGNQLRLFESVRDDMTDFAHHVDERLGR